MQLLRNSDVSAKKENLNVEAKQESRPVGKKTSGKNGENTEQKTSKPKKATKKIEEKKSTLLVEKKLVIPTHPQSTHKTLFARQLKQYEVTKPI